MQLAISTAHTHTHTPSTLPAKSRPPTALWITVQELVVQRERDPAASRGKGAKSPQWIHTEWKKKKQEYTLTHTHKKNPHDLGHKATKVGFLQWAQRRWQRCDFHSGLNRSEPASWQSVSRLIGLILGGLPAQFAIRIVLYVTWYLTLSLMHDGLLPGPHVLPCRAHVCLDVTNERGQDDFRRFNWTHPLRNLTG